MSHFDHEKHLQDERQKFGLGLGLGLVRLIGIEDQQVGRAHLVLHGGLGNPRLRGGLARIKMG